MPIRITVTEALITVIWFLLTPSRKEEMIFRLTFAIKSPFAPKTNKYNTTPPKKQLNEDKAISS
jgi:hypothetical protein